MRRFIINVSIFIAITFITFALVFFCAFKYIEDFEHNKTTYISVSHEVNVQRSLKNIDTCSSNKILLIGGSNVGFGFDSQMLLNAFNMPVFNTGTHGGIGLRLQIEFFKDYINKGDIVVIMPEYEQFYGLFLGDEAMIRIVASDTNLKNKMSVRQIIHSVSYTFLALVDMVEMTDFTGVYGSCSLNKYGDVSEYRKHIMINPKNIEGKIDYEAITYLKSFVDSCPSSIVLLPPVYQDKSFDINIDKINQIDRILSENGIGYDAKPSRYRFDDSLMYDTPYHCTTEGAIIRTNLVIEDIQRVLGK